MLNKSGKKYSAAFAVVTLVLISSNFRASIAAVERTWNIYRLTLDKLTFDLGRGQTVQLQVEVQPPDQEVVFYTSEPGMRMDISVDQTTGRFRSVMVHDSTSEGDGSPNSPATVQIKARLPDGTDAKMPTGEDVGCVVQLVKPYYERMLDAAKNPAGGIQILKNSIPRATHDYIDRSIKDEVVRLGAKSNSVPSQEFLDAIPVNADKFLGITNFSNKFGENFGAEIESAIKTSDVSQGSTLVPRDAPPLQLIEDPDSVIMSIVPYVNGYGLNFLDGTSGDKFNFTDFIQDPTVNFSHTEIQMTATAHLDATLKKGDFSIKAESSFKVWGRMGGNISIDPSDKSLIKIEFKGKFGGQ